jgi:cyclopropane fatty-acyl-phospholipid synthase-like methyltransferase
MDYNSQYSSNKALFGDIPEKLLSENYLLIDNSKPILDIGAGQGRHSLFLARNGYAVEALEPSEVGLTQIEKIAEIENLPIFCSLGDIYTFEPKADVYSAVLIFGLLQILNRSEIEYLFENLKTWIGSGGLVFISTFSISDPSYNSHKNDDKEIGYNSFEDKSGNIRTYFEEKEILQLFSEFENIEFNSRMTPDHHHGDGRIHRHNIIEGIFRRK